MPDTLAPDALQTDAAAEPAKVASAPAPAAAGGPAPGPTGQLRQFPTVDPQTIREAFESGTYPYARPMGTKVYEAEKVRLQAELLKVQLWAQETGQKFVILFEGRDAAGKGGTIKRFMEHLNPRYARVVALTKPSEVERGQWFFQRYIAHLPTAGEMVF